MNSKLVAYCDTNFPAWRAEGISAEEFIMRHLESLKRPEPIKLAGAVDTLTQALETDADYRRSWEANIVMSMYDALTDGRGQVLPALTMRTIDSRQQWLKALTDGARTFLNRLTVKPSTYTPPTPEEKEIEKRKLLAEADALLLSATARRKEIDALLDACNAGRSPGRAGWQ